MDLGRECSSFAIFWPPKKPCCGLRTASKRSVRSPGLGILNNTSLWWAWSPCSGASGCCAWFSWPCMPGAGPGTEIFPSGFLCSWWWALSWGRRGWTRGAVWVWSSEELLGRKTNMIEKQMHDMMIHFAEPRCCMMEDMRKAWSPRRGVEEWERVAAGALPRVRDASLMNWHR